MAGGRGRTNPEMRRLSAADADAAAALYRAAGRDGAWAEEALVRRAAALGELAGCCRNNVLTVCAGTGAQRFPELYAAVRKTGLTGARARILLPPAGADADASFFQLLLALAGPHGGPVWLPVPVQSGSGMVQGCFEAGFALRAVRPLYRLRPHYLFESDGREMKKNMKCSIMIPIKDTLTLSRLLEDGMRGIGLRTTRGAASVCLTDVEKDVDRHETRDSGEIRPAGR